MLKVVKLLVNRASIDEEDANGARMTLVAVYEI